MSADCSIVEVTSLDFDVDAAARRLLSEGYVILRCEGMDMVRFRSVSECFGEGFISGQGGGNHGRTPLEEDATIFTATGSGHLYPVPLHGERYFTANPPELLFFYCVMPADHGGETLVCDGTRLYRALPARLRQLFAGRRITYVRRHEGKVWHEVYQTESLIKVQELCRQSGIELETFADGSITTRYTCSALKNTHRGTAFINNLLPFVWREVCEGRRYGSYVCFEDGTPLSRDAVLEIAALAKCHSKTIQWRQGDIALVDNRFMLHGRDELVDARRTLYLRMAENIRLLPNGKQ